MTTSYGQAKLPTRLTSVIDGLAATYVDAAVSDAKIRVHCRAVAASALLYTRDFNGGRDILMPGTQ